LGNYLNTVMNQETANSSIGPRRKVGILGGGQLGLMLCQAAIDWDLDTYILDQSKDYPAAGICKHFTEGNFRDYNDVMSFGKELDLITIEIEDVSLEALYDLEKMGKTIHPKPSALATIKDKTLQKKYYKDKHIPTAPFIVFEDKQALISFLENNSEWLPCIWKNALGGYDGKGVKKITSLEEAMLLPDVKCLIEELVDIDKEIAVIAARNANGDIRCFDTVEMDFHPQANLVEYLISPSSVNDIQKATAKQIAVELIDSLDICGLLAVEMFLTKDNEILVNEVAPRPHNSGHHTIEAAFTSQFQQHLRGILNLPLGDTTAKYCSIMVNLLGEEGHSGPVQYEGAGEVLSIAGVYLHFYGKSETKPVRKMGHATILSDNMDDAKSKASKVKSLLKVISV